MSTAQVDTLRSAPIGGRAESASDYPGLMDVWSRSGSKYRIRAIVLLGVNIVLFAGLGSFAFWLRSGVWVAPLTDGYWDQFSEAFRFATNNRLTLASLLVEPINVRDVPMQIPILGLLMAALIAIPILVSILYRFPSSLPFVAVVGLVAVMPWLAITLLGSCLVASVRPFRTRFRFVSALVALVPIVVYLLLAWRGSADTIVGRIDPIDRIKFVAPWVLAVVAAGVTFAIVLMIARLVDYRPGAITPLLAIMFGLPVALFEVNVGRDELNYRLLERRARAHFADVDASSAWHETARRNWKRYPLPRPAWQATQELAEQQWLFELSDDVSPNESILSKHQLELVAECDRFLLYFPDSRYASNTLYIKARARSMRIDARAFRETKWIRFYDDFPNAATKNTWQMVLANNPDSPLGAVAGLRLAQLNARSGKVELARDQLATMIRRFDQYRKAEPASAAAAGSLSGVLARGAPEDSLDIPLGAIVLEAHRLFDLFTNNRDPLYGYEPISGPVRSTEELSFGLMDLDPRHERYADHLRTLLARYPHCQIEDNILVELGKAAASSDERIARFEECLRRFSERDAVPEAMFRLADAYRSAGRSDAAAPLLNDLVAGFPDSVWARQVQRGPVRITAIRRTRTGP